MKHLLAWLLLACSAWSVSAQQLLPERDSQRTFISFGEAAPLIYAAAVNRAKPNNTDKSLSVAASYERVFEFSKQIASKYNDIHAVGGFSYLSFLPSLIGGKIYGETLSYTFGFGSVSVLADRDLTGFSYRLRPIYQSSSIGAAFNQAVRIYNFDADFTFKNLPKLVGSAVTLTTLCTKGACAVLPLYELGRYRWFFRDPAQSFMVACNEVSDCVQAVVSYDFYAKTYTLRTTGSDPNGQYYGAYSVRPGGNCSDNRDFNYLGQTVNGLVCMFSLQFNKRLGHTDQYFTVTGDHESQYMRTISLQPVPVVCPGATKYFQFLSCDQRFVDDVISPNTLALLVDRVSFWGAQRFGYTGYGYTPISVKDVTAALGSNLVRVSSLAEVIAAPSVASPGAAASSPTGGASTPAPAVDFGADPGIAAPTVEQVGASEVMASLWGLFPSLSAFSTGSYAVQCPVFTPSVFGSVLHISAHCDLAEGQRAALGALSLVAWAATALLIVLRS